MTSAVQPADALAVDAMTRLFAFLDRPPRQVAVGTAEGLKYACNAFHAAKISFANEMARVLRLHGIDTREVMDVFCDDDKPNKQHNNCIDLTGPSRF